MRNRLNVVYLGKRTTARFPGYLWRLSLIATRLSDEVLADKVRSWVATLSETQPRLVASQVVQHYLVNLIEIELFAAGFNPGTSRAPVPGHSPGPSAAEASPTTAQHDSPQG